MKGNKIISILFIIIWWSIQSALDMISEDIGEDYNIDYYWIYGITFVLSMIIILFFNIEQQMVFRSIYNLVQVKLIMLDNNNTYC